METPPIIGLTGGIGSGKSQVAALLGAAGCFVADADQFAREALRHPEVIALLRERWGAGVIDDDGGIDRAAVAGIVFADSDQRRWLESIIHPRVEAARRAAFASVSPPPRAFVIDAPLLLEAGLDEGCDQILFVEASEPVRLERVRRNRGWSAEELARREAVQLPLDEKRSRAHHVLVNNGQVTDLARSVERYLDELTPDQSSSPET